MKVFVVLAHPESASLNHSLKNITMDVLQKAGHKVIVSDLYQMNWKASADAGDFLIHDEKERMFYERSSKKAYEEGTQTPDIEAEQDKLLWADMIIFHFPLWWFSMPAILKGWVERVYAYGFGYGVGKHEGKYWGLRYGEGTLQGKKAMLVVTAGGREPHYKETGVNGPIDDLLFPINHGIL
jgi:NAD(P)H dehydrogenase (quinone)